MLPSHPAVHAADTEVAMPPTPGNPECASGPYSHAA